MGFIENILTATEYAFVFFCAVAWTVIGAPALAESAEKYGVWQVLLPNFLIFSVVILIFAITYVVLERKDNKRLKRREDEIKT